MAAAASIAVLFALSSVIVRVASVALRLTGLSDDVARLQCISAMTGTGYTTGESELIVNYPVRRKILIGLMIIGNLGLISVATTAIVSIMETDMQSGALIRQTALIVLAAVVTLIVMANRTVDNVMCGLVGWLLHRFTSLGARRVHRLLQLESGFSVAAHQYRGTNDLTVSDLNLPAFGLELPELRGKAAAQSGEISGTQPIEAGDTITCFGSEKAHEDFEASLSRYTG